MSTKKTYYVGNASQAIWDWKGYEKEQLRPIGKWFSRAFRKPSTKFPESTGANTSQLAYEASEEAMMAKKKEEKARLRRSAGRRSLIAGGGKGVLDAPTTLKKKLGE